MLLQFWLLASSMLAAALALVLPPLLRDRAPASNERRRELAMLYHAQRDELAGDLASNTLDRRAHAEACAELDRRLLEDSAAAPAATAVPADVQPMAAVVIALLVPLLAFGMYLQLGKPSALSPGSASPAQDTGIPHAVEEMIDGLRQRLAGQPDDAEGWVMLGRSYARLNRLPEARDALAEARRLRPAHVLTLVAYAEVLAGLAGNRLAGEPLALIEQALRIEPDFARALWLAGVAHHNNGDQPRALAAWQRLQALGLEPAAAEQVARAIAAAGGAAPEAPAVSTASIAVSVRLAPSLAARVRPGDTLFVFARALDGPRMPLAIVRRSAHELPLTVTLDDSQAMTPQLRLSRFAEVTVGARLSRSGNATPQTGDLQGASGAVRVAGGARAVVVIADVVP